MENVPRLFPKRKFSRHYYDQATFWKQHPQGTGGSSSLQKASLAMWARFSREPLSSGVPFGLLFALSLSLRVGFVVSENNLHLETYVKFQPKEQLLA